MHQALVIAVALLAELPDQLPGFFLRQETAGLDGVDEQFQLRKLEIPGADVVAAVFAPAVDNVETEVYIIAGDRVISCYGKGKSPRNSTPSDNLNKVISTRSSVVLDAIEMGAIFEEQPAKEGYLIAEPVLVGGDLLGTVIVVSKVQLDENKLGYIRFASAVLGAVVGQ